MKVRLTLEDEIVHKVQRIAAERGTTLTGLVREYLTKLASGNDAADRNARKLTDPGRAFDLFSVKASPRSWKRSDLYERR
jgi:hypothetical protein